MLKVQQRHFLLALDLCEQNDFFQGKTSVKKSYHPEWKEQLTFIDMFPPLCNRLRIQLYDHDTVKDEAIATHFIELTQIMDPGGDTEGRSQRRCNLTLSSKL